MTIIILSHGSRGSKGNDLSKEVAEELAKRLERKAVFANLQLSEPYLIDVVKELYEKGEREFIIHPFFLHEGIHVTDDIPKEIEELQKEYQDASFKITPITGKSRFIKEAAFNIVSGEL